MFGIKTSFANEAAEPEIIAFMPFVHNSAKVDLTWRKS